MIGLVDPIVQLKVRPVRIGASYHQIFAISADPQAPTNVVACTSAGSCYEDAIRLSDTCQIACFCLEANK